MVKELTYSAYSIIEEYYRIFQTENISEDFSKRNALNRIRNLRYGKENKNYF